MEKLRIKMIKLKTLKDLRVAVNGRKNEFVVYEDEVRKEAINWAKDGLKKERNWFKIFLEFHNITKEELLE